MSPVQLQTEYHHDNLITSHNGTIRLMPQLSKMNGPTGLLSAKGSANALPFGQWVAQQAGCSGMIGSAFTMMNASPSRVQASDREGDCGHSADTGNPLRRGL